MKKRLLRIRGGGSKSEKGQALVEFAVVSIVFFMMIFGLFDLTRLFQSWMTVQHAAREGARYAITGQVLCTGYASGDHRDDCIVQTAKAATEGIPGGGEGSGSVGVTFEYWEFPDYAGSATAGSGDPCDQLEVSVTYRHHFATPLIAAIVPSGIDIAGKQRMNNEPFGSCQPPDP